MKKRKPAETTLPAGPTANGATRWVMLMPNLPGKATSERVRIWRRLQNVGAVAVRPSVYVLPAREPHFETFQWIAREIIQLGGQASLCEGAFLDGTSDDEIERKFIEARSADYTALAEEARELVKVVKRKRLGDDALRAAEVQIARLKRRYEEVVAIDFVAAPGREGVEGLIASLERAALDHRAPVPEEHLERVARPRGITWVTRTGVHVDRIACSWLIRRFIDPDATLKFVPAKGYVPELGELRFDMYDAEFTHVGDRCSFEVLLQRMGIEDPALQAIGEIVHDIHVRDEKFDRAEVEGVRSQITGVCTAHRDDLARIAAATPIFESLYPFFSIRARTKKGEK